MRWLCVALALLLAPVAEARNPIGTAVGSKATVQPAWPADIPKILSEADAALYEELFDKQRDLRRTEVARQLQGLEDKRTLMGHLIGIRLLHPLTRTPYDDMRAWLNHYHDHANAPAVYELANSRRPKGADAPRRPSVSQLSVARYSEPADPEAEPAVITNSSERQKLLRRLRYYRVKGYYDKSLAELDKPSVIQTLSEETWGQVCVTLARSMMHDHEYAKVAVLMNKVDERLGMRQPAARWLHGFAEYRFGNTAVAAKLWRTLAYDLPTESRYYPQASWWAATAYGDMGRHAMARVFFNMAAQNATSFYGLLANERLDRGDLIRWRAPTLDETALNELLKDPGIRRTVALAQIGEYGLAQAELRASYERVPYDYDETLLALALRLNLANPAMTLARNLQERGQTYLLGLYPLIEQWVPNGHVSVDPALLHAIIRQESAFDPGVVSRAGARGLMQLMPNTARYVTRLNGDKPHASYKIYEPNINTELGQDYLIYLKEKMNGNLLAMISAYNAGPGNVSKWLADEQIGSRDPVLFIESIPFGETRNYVKKVLTNYWLYRRQFGADTPTLQKLSHNKWPEAFLEPINYQAPAPVRQRKVAPPELAPYPAPDKVEQQPAQLPKTPEPAAESESYQDILQPPKVQ